jgi:membrane protein
MLRINSFQPMDNVLLAIGDAGNIMETRDRGKTWLSVKKGSKIGYTVINFLAPFFFIWLLFLPAYITLPNIKVPLKASALGAAVTGAVWVVFILLFIIYVKQFAQGTFAIYGALAAIPLFLLMIYASSLIILFGAEVAFTFMYPETYRNLSKKLKQKYQLQVYHGMAVLKYIYDKFEKGRGDTSLKELQNKIQCAPDEIASYINLFDQEKLILQNKESAYIPANSSENLFINDIIDLVMSISFVLPAAAEKTSYRHFMAGLFAKITAGRRHVVGNITLKDLIDKK